MGSGSSRRRGRAAERRDAPELRDAPERRDAPELRDVPELRDAPELRDVPERRDVPQPGPGGTEGAAAPPAPARPAPGGIPDPRAAGSGGAPLHQAALSTRSSPGPENNNADIQCPESDSKKAPEQSTISYDYSEEELMASIEREYCR